MDDPIGENSPSLPLPPLLFYPLPHPSSPIPFPPSPPPPPPPPVPPIGLCVHSVRRPVTLSVPQAMAVLCGHVRFHRLLVPAGPGTPPSPSLPPLSPPCCMHGEGLGLFPSKDRPVGLVVKAPASRAGVPGSSPAFVQGIFPGRVTPLTERLVFQWLPCQASGLLRSATGLVGLVSVYCDWVR